MLPEKYVILVDDHPVGLHSPTVVDCAGLILGQVEGQVLGLRLL
jgi:hypothetical protein